MALNFRRGRRVQFRHIAHGLVPAATIAPKPAVPRTPPPRSPNPSPERPRSALAAAILATTLTGRTIAIPQPRQRSFSESDASCLQDHDSYNEPPYATVTELRTGPKWKNEGDEKTAEQSFAASGSYCEAEDWDTSLSDTEKEPEPNFQAVDLKESVSSEVIYAVPHKVKKETHLVSSSTNEDDDEPSLHETSWLTHPNVQVEEIEPSVETFKMENVSSENVLHGKPPPSQDVALRSKQGQMERNREKFQKLKEENWYLNNSNQTLLLQLEETKQLMKELQLEVKRLEKENRRLNELAQNSYREEKRAELLSLRQQAQELVDENDSLKMTVHRLNVELSRYQAKYRPVSPNEGVKIAALPMKGPVPPWLVDTKYLSPLLLAYEDRMREKDDLIQEHEEDMKNFKAQVEQILKENEELHQQLSKNSSVSTREWQHLQSQAKLVLEENAVLMEQLKIQQAKDSHSQHTQEVSKLTKQLKILETKKNSEEQKLKDTQKQLEELQCLYKELKASFQGSITMEEHVALVNKLNSQGQQEQEKRESDLQELMGKLASVQAEKKSLLMEKNGLVAENKTLEAALETAQKEKRRLQTKSSLLKQQLEEALEKESSAHLYLANLIHLAEKIIKERDHLLNLTSCLETEKQGVLTQVMEGNVRLGRLEEKVKVYKKNAARKLGDLSLKATEQEKEFSSKAAEYQREMKHLQWLLQEKQESLDEVLQQKREMEGELEVIWESTTKENRRMKELLHKYVEKKIMEDPVKPCEPNFPAVSQKDLLDGYGFSYCDVQPSLPAKTESQPECVC